MLGYYAIYASPEGQRLIRAAERGEDTSGILPHQIGARNAGWTDAGWFLPSFLRHAKRMS